MLYVDAKAAGVIEAKKAGFTLSGVETQSGASRYLKLELIFSSTMAPGQRSFSPS
jgi:hypothetical protein